MIMYSNVALRYILQNNINLNHYNNNEDIDSTPLLSNMYDDLKTLLGENSEQARFVKRHTSFEGGARRSEAQAC